MAKKPNDDWFTRLYGRACVYDIRVGDEVLYVGCSHTPQRRFESHRRAKWFKRGSHLVIVGWFDSRSEAFSAEAKRIHLLRPVGNKMWAKELPKSALPFAKARQRWNARGRRYGKLTDCELISRLPGWTLGMARNLLGNRSWAANNISRFDQYIEKQRVKHAS